MCGPILAMTANAFAEDVRRSLDAGMAAKPLDIRELNRGAGTFCRATVEKRDAARG